MIFQAPQQTAGYHAETTLLDDLEIGLQVAANRAQRIGLNVF